MRPEDEAQRRHGLAPPAHSLSTVPIASARLCVHPVLLTLSRSGPPPGPPLRVPSEVSPRGSAGPDGVFLLGLGDDAPSVRKPSLAIREGALGYRTPQPPPLLWKRVRLAAPVSVRSGPSRAGFERPSGDTAVPHLSGPRLPPPSRGRVPPGRGRRPSRGSAALRYVSVHARDAASASGVWGGGAAEAFPVPRRSRSRASSGSPPAPATRVRSRRVCCAGTVGARLVLGGRSARDASPSRPGRTGQMNGWAAGGKPRRLPLWLLRVWRV